MGRDACGTGRRQGGHRPRRHDRREPVVSGRTCRSDPPGHRGAPRGCGCRCRADLGRDHRAADQDGRSGHGAAQHGHNGASQEAARIVQALFRLWPKPDAHPAPSAQDPSADPRQGAGSARLVPVDAILAGRVRRQYPRDAALPSGALCRPARLVRGEGGRTGGIPRCGSLPPRSARHEDHDRCRRSAAPRRGDGHGRHPDAAQLHPVG